MVAVGGAETVHEVVCIGFIVAEDLLYPVLEGDGAEIGVFNIVLLDGGDTLAVDVHDLNHAGDGLVIAVGIALDVVLEGDGDGTGSGERVGNLGLTVLREDTVEVIQLLLEVGLLGDPDGLAEVSNVEGGGKRCGLGVHFNLSLSLSLFVCDGQYCIIGSV